MSLCPYGLHGQQRLFVWLGKDWAKGGERVWEEWGFGRLACGYIKVIRRCNGTAKGVGFVWDAWDGSLEVVRGLKNRERVSHSVARH